MAEGDATAQTLTRPLYERSIAAIHDLSAIQRTALEHDDDDDDDEEEEDEEDEEEEEAGQPIRALLCRHGRLDCALLVQGKLLFAHRVLLAKRR